MQFKKFLEDNGLMFNVLSKKKPSDGMPFKDRLSSVAPKDGDSSMPPSGQQPMFMKKKMKKS